MKHFKLFALAMLSVGLVACQTQNINLPKKPEILKKMTMNTQHTWQSRHDFATTVSKIQQGVQAKGMTVFAVIDHQAAAQQVNMTMQPATVIVFGTPKAGTPLMVKDPKFALQLPLKVLVTEQNGQVQVVMTKAEALIAGSQISAADVENSLAKAEVLIPALIQ